MLSSEKGEEGRCGPVCSSRGGVSGEAASLCGQNGWNLEQLFHASAEAILILGRNKRVLRANDTFLRIFGFSREEVEGKLCFEVLRAPFCNGPNCPLERSFDAVETLEFRMNVPAKTGENVPCLVFATPLRDGEGRVVAVAEQFRDMTEWQRLERLAAKGDARFRLLVEKMGLFLVELDTRLRFTFLNPAAEVFFGIASGNSGNAVFQNFVHESRRIFFEERLRAIARERSVSDSFRLHHITAAGKEFHVHWSVIPHFSEKGEVEGFTCLGRNVSEEHRLSGELQRMALFPLANPNMVFQIDTSGDITFANPSAWKWLGEHGFEDLRGLENLLPPNYKELLERSLSLGDFLSFDIAWKGHFYDVKLTPFPRQETCMVNVTDVTEYRKIAQERELLYRAFQDSIHGMTVTDITGKILYVNRAFEELYGYSQEEALGKTPRILNPGRKVYRDLGYTEEQYDRLFSGMWESIVDPQKGRWEGELVNRRKDGTLMWVHLYISAVRDERGELMAFLGTPMDITQRVEEERNTRLDLYRALAETAEARDMETGAHLLRVSTYCRIVGAYLGLVEKELLDLEIFAPFHDIGKVGIPDSVLLAPRKLSPEEFEIMKTHTTIGYNILHGHPSLETAAEIALTHHENYDGTGYPRRLAGSAIPLNGRIVALADVYDALRSRRPYKVPWTHGDASNFIRAQSGMKFDPAVVRAFVALEEEFQEIAERFSDEREG
jgi:PAS domain S-box-containing protein